MDMDAKCFHERRRMARYSVYKHGKIVGGFNVQDSICRIRNMTDYGAELDIGAEQQLPDEFVLSVRADGHTYRCRCRWREGKRVGVEFL